MFGGIGRVATSILATDTILVSLAYSKPDGQRVAVQERFDGEGNPIDQHGEAIDGASLELVGVGGGDDAPEFNQSAYNTLIKQGKRDAARAMKTQHEIDVAVFESEGGTTNPSDAVRNAALAFVREQYDVQTKDRSSGPVIKPEQVIVKAPSRNASGTNPGVWAVQMAPSWGSK